MRRARAVVLIAAAVLGGLTAPRPVGALAVYAHTTTDRFAQMADPDGSGRVVCGHDRLTATMNSYGPSEPFMRIESRTRTYQGFYPSCPSNLPQAPGELKTRLRAYWLDASNNWVKLIETYPIAENVGFSSVVDQSWQEPRSIPGGYYYFRAGHEWTPWTSYFHTQSGADIPVGYFCRGDITPEWVCELHG